jgi:hypothetical protein
LGERSEIEARSPKTGQSSSNVCAAGAPLVPKQGQLALLGIQTHERRHNSFLHTA